MKTVIFFTLLLFVFASCETNKGKEQHTVILIDITEETGVVPNKDELLAFAELEADIDGKYFCYTFINEQRHNVRHGVLISSAQDDFFYDELSRIQVVEQYKNNIDSLLCCLDTVTFGRPQSQIFRRILEESRFLMAQHGDSPTLIVYSDLVENSSFFSLQHERDRRLLLQPDKLQVHFEEKFSIGKTESFRGLHIEIHHVPNRENEETFEAFLLLYERVFESRGAEVTHTVSKITNAGS